ncbi:hypothetical protein EPN96_03090 [bacterium]|nr:MAG: hypothetical protein EPN96_03090 [bacterium]
MTKNLLSGFVTRVIPQVFFAAAVAAIGVLCLPFDALADHSLDNKCVACHTLRSTNVVPGSRNVLFDRVNDFLYQSEWYCGAGVWGNLLTTASTPLDCSYCHEVDVAFEIQIAKGGKRNVGIGVGSAHPVDVLGDEYTYAANIRIVCNDCHNGATPGTLVPETLCTKSATDGYPNHQNMVIGAGKALPGANNLTDNPPRLSLPYGTDVDWTKATFVAADVLCFICHDASDSTNPPYSGASLIESGMKNIMADYNRTGGGHNTPNSGTGVGNVANKKLACYHCHDPHASTDPPPTGTANNEALILNLGGINKAYPYGAPGDNDFTASGYIAGGTANGDVKVCAQCHNGTTKVENVAVMQWNLAFPGNYKFAFHKNAHNGATSCLTKNGGCHQSPHYNNTYACLDCHSSNTTFGTQTNAKLLAVNNVGSELDLLNGIKSKHNLNYNPALPLNVVANNGCLACHNVPATLPNDGRIVALPNGTTFAPPTTPMPNWQSLVAYDDFCIGCHDGSVDADETMSGLKAPRVEKYFRNGGHGNTSAFVSANRAAKIPCLQCHVYHGSTAFKLLPGNVQTIDGKGKVVKGFDYTPRTTGTTFTLGGMHGTEPNTTRLDYTDYTLSGSSNNGRLTNDNRKAWKFADYTNSNPWSTYYESTGNTPLPTDPAGTEVSFGTSGDMLDPAKVPCGSNATNAPKLGFCNACHFSNNSTDGTVDTLGWVYTHEADQGGDDCSSTLYKSTLDMHKDCSECHDPHGSGDAGSNNPNWFMVRGKIATGFGTGSGDWDTYNVVLDSPAGDPDGIFAGPDGLDEIDADNRDDICAVCHTTTDHNNRAGAEITPHPEGGDCTICHDHGGTKGAPFTGNQALLGFPIDMQPGYPICFDCHGGNEPVAGDKPYEASDGVANMVNSTQYNTYGHGLDTASQYPAPNRLGARNSGAGYTDGTSTLPTECTVCHDDSTAHLPKASSNPYRLIPAYAANTDGLCNTCHGVSGTASRINMHIHSRAIMVAEGYGGVSATWPGTNYAFKCVDCHDPHGDNPNVFMVKSHISAPTAAGDTSFGSNQYGTPQDKPNISPVLFDDVDPTDGRGPGYPILPGPPGGICEVCHNQTIYFKRDGSANETHMLATRCATCHKHEDGFAPSACNGCHGFPPEPGTCTPSTATEQNYTGGGGPHLDHVRLLAAKTGAEFPAVNNFDAVMLCDPCHGDGSGSNNHNDSNKGIGCWDLATSRGFVNIRGRSLADSWGVGASYGGSALPTTPSATSMDTADSACKTVNCHGTDASDNTGNVVNWNLGDYSTEVSGHSPPSAASDGQNLSKVCKGCHDRTPANIKIWDDAATPALKYGPAGSGATATYNDDKIVVADNYFATLSGYSRGGHGDPKIQLEDPLVNSDTSHVTPIDCTSCHNSNSVTTPHFPAAAANFQRLLNTLLEDSNHTSGLCSECHSNTSYPGPPGNLVHHPSHTGTKDAPAALVVPNVSQEIMSNIDGTFNWVEWFTDRWEQSRYGAGGVVGTFTYDANPDRAIDWWDGNPGQLNMSPTVPPKFLRNPFNGGSVALPLEKYVVGTTSTNPANASNRVICVTCHNPHGTDLRVFVTTGGDLTQIPDNNMLRLRESDNTLCHGCH